MSSMPVQHAPAFRRRRFLNWFPMGLTYALLYMGRYNLTVSKNALGDLMTKEDFGIIFGAGTVTYAFAFLLNGPLVDKIGGRKGILIASLGAGLMNLCMGLYLWQVLGAAGGATSESIRLVFTLLYCGNMYFQSYGAVAIVKVNAHWFHVRERGGFSGIFGTMISSGIFLAFTVNGWILNAAASTTSEAAAAKWVFFAPAALLFAFFLIELFILRDSPSGAGYSDFDTGDASSGEEGVDVPVLQIMKRVVTNPIILTVALIEFCTGVIRNGVMHWFPIYAKEVWVLPGGHTLRYGSWGAWWMVALFFGVAFLFFWLGARAKGPRKGWLFVSGALVFLAPFLQGGWGGILFVAGVIGANVAGWVSDLFFGSRRAPVAAILYSTLAIASIGMFFTLGGTENRVGWSEAPGAPFEAGDTVTRIAGIEVDTWADVDRALAECTKPLQVDDGNWIMAVEVLRNGESELFEISCAYDENGPPAWGILPENGMRAADPSAAPVILGLQPGDEIIGLAGTTDMLAMQLSQAPFTSWDEVSHAVSAVPAVGIGKARWDPEKLMCTYSGTGIPEGEEPSTGLLCASIERDGEALTVVLRDPSPAMRAGDKRKLSAGPVLLLSPLWLGLIVFIMSIGVIGTHGLLSGTATMDFGGRKGAATAVGMIDGFVYLGTGLQSFALGYLTTEDWSLWPVFLFPFGVIGFLLLCRIWNAIPKGRKAAH
jgi:OPA family glycerol-3-phosphate transporter-like MFS transporter